MGAQLRLGAGGAAVVDDGVITHVDDAKQAGVPPLSMQHRPSSSWVGVSPFEHWQPPLALTLQQGPPVGAGAGAELPPAAQAVDACWTVEDVSMASWNIDRRETDLCTTVQPTESKRTISFYFAIAVLFLYASGMRLTSFSHLYCLILY